MRITALFIGLICYCNFTFAQNDTVYLKEKMPLKNGFIKPLLLECRLRCLSDGIEISSFNKTDSVFAVAGGTVLVANIDINEKMIIVKLDNNLWHTYHFQTNAINYKKGDTINRGDLIAIAKFNSDYPDVLTFIISKQNAISISREEHLQILLLDEPYYVNSYKR